MCLLPLQPLKMAGAEGELLCAPPTEFKRMLSWQLSRPHDIPVSSSKKKVKKRKKPSLGGEEVHSLLSDEPSSLGDDNFDQFGGDFSDLDCFGYIVVNSEGEEEVYFSAPESPPLCSDDDFDDVATTASDWSTADVQLKLPPQERKPGGRSKKSKKKSKYLAKMAEVEFFQPLCDLVEDKLSVDVGRLDLSSQAEVPTLVELSIRKIRSQELVHSGTNLPFLIHSLLGQDSQLRSVVSTHVRWLERLLAALEVASREHDKERQQKGRITKTDPQQGRAYCQQAVWDPALQLNELPGDSSGMHCPLPEPFNRTNLRPYDPIPKDYQMRPLFHFTNYLFPLFTARGNVPVQQEECSGSPHLSPSQRAAIYYVNNFLKSRYKSLSNQLSETLKLWPGYLYWARGQLKLAASAFGAAIDSLTHSHDQAVALNEVGRMFLHFRDRSSACRFFRKSASMAIATRDQDVYKPLPELVHPCAFALEASAWDCGWLDGSVAREAARAWGLVVKEATHLPSTFWFLHLAACESKLFIHAGKPVGTDPSSPLEGRVPSQAVSGPTHQWLKECEGVLVKLSEKFQVLYYHLSLVYAMLRMPDLSRKAFQSFYDNYVGFREWPDGILPGDLFSTILHRSQRNPWMPLVDLLANQGLPHAPILQLQWRLRLLHPLYPYVRPEGVSYLADHGSPGIGLRLTNDGYLTADMHMDLPPLRCVLIDPYTGSLNFSRSASLQHFYLNQLGEPVKPERCVLPWPLRLFESERCVVELVEGTTTDFQVYEKTESNYTAMLHWYDSQGAHRKLDIRRAVRKSLRKAILDLAEKKDLKGKEAMLDKMMDMGYHVDIRGLRNSSVPSKYKKQKVQGKDTAKPQKVRNQNVSEFVLRLTSHVVYGEGTLMMCFLLDPWAQGSSPIQGQVLMFVNCTSCDSFMDPRVYCVADDRGFQHLYPSAEMASAYPNRHLKHIRYAMAARTEHVPNPSDDHEQIVFDQNGDVVYKEHLHVPVTGRNTHKPSISSKELEASCSLGDRLFHWEKNGEESEVLSFNTHLCPESKLQSVPFQSITISDVVPVPGLLFVHTLHGLCLLHPGNLQSVTVEGLMGVASPDPADLNPHIQLKGDDRTFQVVKVYNVEGQCTEVVRCSEHSQPEGQEGWGEGVSAAGGVVEAVSTQVETKLEQGGVLGERDSTSGEDEAKSTTKTENGKRRETGDFGSCCVAFTINNRLLVLAISHRTEAVRVTLDVKLPGRVTELHPMGKLGYLLSVTQFPDQFREDVYWLSEDGKLLGMLPCLGAGPRSFVSATLSPRLTPISPHTPAVERRGLGDEEENGGLYMFFSDGQGGICCVRPTVN